MNELAHGVLEAVLARARGGEPRKPKRNRGHLPPDLPRVERVIQSESTLCPCGCGEMVKIGEDISERLDVIPAQFQVLEHVGPDRIRDSQGSLSVVPSS